MQNILVSVCCLAYNQKDWIQKCLDGVLSQRCDFSYEVIIHDDYSTDGTREIIKEYNQKYPDKISLILPESNQYSQDVDMFDRCVSIATGKYIAWCEGDDEWTDPSKLQKQVDYMENHPECSLVYTNADFYIERQNRIEHNALTSGFIHSPKNFKEHLLRAGHLAPLTWLFRRKLYVPNTKRDVDWSYSIALDMFAQGDVHFLDYNTATYRIFNESVSNSKTIRSLLKFGKGLIQIKEKYFLRYSQLLTSEETSAIRYHTYLKYLPAAICLNDREYIAKSCELLEFANKTLLVYIIKYRNVLMIPIILKLLYRLKGRR